MRTPSAIIARFHEALLSAFRVPQVVERMTTAQQVPIVLASPEKKGRFIAREVETWGKVVGDNNIEPD